MPGVNPVASTPGVSQSKSFRSRLGFGGSGGAPSTKPSFFSLKSGRKSFGGSGDLKGYEYPVLVIDAHSEHGLAPHESHVVLNEDSAGDPLSHTSPPKSESPIKDLPFQLPRNIISHSLPASPTRGARHNPDSSTSRGGFQSSSPSGAGTHFDPNESGLSKHLPELSADLSLLMNEPPPDTVSQSDLHESKTSHSDTHGSTAASSKGKARETRSVFDSSVAVPEPQRWNRQDLGASVHHAPLVVSSPPRGLEGSESAVSGFTSGAVENASASFDLSNARLSLDLMRQSLGGDWAKSLVGDSAAPSAETSALLSPPVASFAESSSGLVTSTPFRSPSASPARPQYGDVSFNLDALDPDLVALLRPNTFNQETFQVDRVVTPSPSEPFAPPPDPLNPDTTAKRPPESLSPLSNSSLTRGEGDGISQSPVRKYATLTASNSPVRPLRLPRSRTQELPPHVSTPSTVDDRFDIQRLHPHAPSEGRPAFSTVTSSDTGPTSDISKQPSPLSAAPLTLGDLERTRESSPAQSSAASTSASNINNVTTRRRLRQGTSLQAHAPRPSSVLTSSVESRPVARYSYQDRDRELRQASASPAPSSPGPSTYASGSLGRDRDRVRPSLDGIFHERFSPRRSVGRSNSVSGEGGHNVPHAAQHMSGAFPKARDRDWDLSADRRYRKRSMSLDQHSGGTGPRGTPEDSQRSGSASSRFRPLSDRDRGVEWAGSEGSEYSHGPRGGLGPSFDGRYRDLDRNYERYGYAYGDRERPARTQTDWLGPRTVKAFAAAGLLDDSREPSDLRYGAFTRSTSERDFRAAGTGQGRERERWSPIIGGALLDGDRDRGHHRFAPSIRDRDFTSSGMRAGAETPSTSSATRPSSRGDHSSHSRQAPLFARTMSDLMSQRGSADGRDGHNTAHYRPGSAYSPGAGESAGSGGGRASPTTTSSLVAAQSQIQTLKDKHDTQTEALFAALADSQKTARELKEENEALKGQLRMLEERLVETIANSRQKEKEFARAMRTRPQSPDRTHIIRSHRNPEYPRPPPSKVQARSPSPKKRRLSTSSSIFPTVPASMTLLMAETPGSPPQDSLGSDSRAPSPTLVLPRLASRQTIHERREIDGSDPAPLVAPQPISISHKRSTSGVSMATSANFSFETGSPGSLKLKPEHELLLGDMTRLSLVTGFGGDSEAEG